jgi:dTDP-4-amino-4,6-dideoxygalactose transaminase
MDFGGSILEGRESWILTSGGVAIAHALRAWGVGPGDEVLVPAYHCRAMTAPIEWLGARPVFYPLQGNLSAREADWTGLITPRTRALILVHYFGFAYEVLTARAFCDRHQLAFIEDCAHAFYTMSEDRPVGRVGDYAIGSPMKFLPMFEGGVLVRRAGVPAPSIEFAPSEWRHEFKAALDVVERAGVLGNLAGLSALIRLAIRLKLRIRSASLRDSSPVVSAPGPGSYVFEPAWLNARPSAISRLILSRAKRQGIAETRRKNYRTLVERLSGVRGTELPFPVLQPGTVPYVFPVISGAGEQLFWSARDAGIQVFRWELTETQECRVTRRYARSLLQFPCHQALNEARIDRIVDVIRKQAH